MSSDTQRILRHKPDAKTGFVLIEMLMVVGIIGLMVGVAMISFTSLWGNQRFKRQADRLVNMFQIAYNAATETGRRYEIVLDSYEQGYMLREFTQFEFMGDVMADESAWDDAVIEKRYFDESLTLEYVYYDDGTDSRSPEFEDSNVYRFFVGRAGWQNGGKIVLYDGDGNPWTIVVHRFARPVELYEGEVDILMPQYAENIPY